MADTVIYEFTSGIVRWSDGANMWDGTETSYAYTDIDGDTQRCTGNECIGTNLGTISKVELRAYAYADDNDELLIQPIFSEYGDEHVTVPGATAGWGLWQDVTNDTNHPDWSSWDHVNDLDCEIDPP